MGKLLTTESLTKDFGQNRGIFSIDLELEPGEIVGFLGPNGAGKTTFMLSATGFIAPTSGKVLVFGGNKLTQTNAHQYYNRMGVLFSDNLYPGFKSAARILSEISNWRKATGIKTKRLLDWREMAEELELNLNSKFYQLSLGNKKKVGIIASLMHSPDLVIMDEPTSGLDPLIQKKFFTLISKIKENGGSVLLSSHVLSEVEAICDRIVMIKAGKITFDGNTRQIRENAQKIFKLELNKLKKISPEAAEPSYWQKLEGIADIRHSQTGEELIIYTSKRAPVLNELLKLDFTDFYLERPTLENMFISEYERNE